MLSVIGIGSRLVLLVSLLLLSVDTSVDAQNLEAQKRALDIIADYAERICPTIPLQGGQSQRELTGNAKAELNEVLKKIANLGIEGAAKYQTSEWQGVLQQDLAGQLNDIRNCKRGISKELQSTLLGQSQSSLQKRGFLQIDNIHPTDGYSDITPGKPFAVNVYYSNPGPEPITNVQSGGRAFVENVDDQRVRLLVEKGLQPIREEYKAGKIKGIDSIGVGKNDLVTFQTIPTPPLTQSEVDGILKGTMRIYLVAWQAWTDSQGYKDFAYECRWLQIHTLPTIVWQLCQR